MKNLENGRLWPRGTFVRVFPCGAYLAEMGDGVSDASVHAEDFVVDGGGQGQEGEQLVAPERKKRKGPWRGCQNVLKHDIYCKKDLQKPHFRAFPEKNYYPPESEKC